MFKYPKIEKMTNEQLAYFAGLLDGEGCIRIGQYKNVIGVKSYRGFIQIAMTNKNAIDWLKENIGGGKYIDYKKNNPNSKVCYYWTVNQKRGKCLIKRALPYLVVKRQQALKFLQFCDTLQPSGYRKRVPNKILSLRKILWENMKLLNMKGVKYATLSQNRNTF